MEIKIDSNYSAKFKKKFPLSCDQCGNIGEYNEKRDAAYCPTCNIWLESTCGDRYCGFCSNRPERPLEDES